MTAAPDELVASAVISAGRSKTGLVVSTTVTLNMPDAERPALSVTEQLTCVIPSEKVEPDAGKHEGAGSGLSSASEPLTLYVTAAPDAPVASAVMSDGRLSVGAVFAGVTEFTVRVKFA